MYNAAISIFRQQPEARSHQAEGRRQFSSQKCHKIKSTATRMRATTKHRDRKEFEK